jgi:hypothetical protein
MKVGAAELIVAPQLMHDTNNQDKYDADDLIFKQKIRTRLMCELIQATIVSSTTEQREALARVLYMETRRS